MLDFIVTLLVAALTGNPQSIIARNFSLVTDTGESVLHDQFDRRRLASGGVTDRLSMKFFAMNKLFEFQFEPSYPIFLPGATIKMTGRVSESAAHFCKQAHAMPMVYIIVLSYS